MLLNYHSEVLLSMSEHTHLTFMNYFNASVDPYLHTKINFTSTSILQINLIYRFEVLKAFPTMPGHTTICYLCINSMLLWIFKDFYLHSKNLSHLSTYSWYWIFRNLSIWLVAIILNRNSRTKMLPGMRFTTGNQLFKRVFTLDNLNEIIFSHNLAVTTLPDMGSP